MVREHLGCFTSKPSHAMLKKKIEKKMEYIHTLKRKFKEWVYVESDVGRIAMIYAAGILGVPVVIHSTSPVLLG